MKKRAFPSIRLFRRFSFLTPTFVAVSVCTLMMVRGATLFAQSADPFDDLRVRIEQLERDNRDLRTALAKPKDDAFIPFVSDSGMDLAALPPSPEEIDSNKSPEDQKLESLVDGMVRRMNAQSKKSAEEQDKRIKALEGKLETALKKNPKGANGTFGNTGLVFTSNDGNFKTHFGGTGQLDFVAPQSTAAGIGGTGFSNPPGQTAGQNFVSDSVFFRRIRVRADGTMYGWIDWVSEFDFAMALQNTQNTPANADNGLRNVPTGGVNPNSSNQQAGNTMNAIQPTTNFITFKDVLGVGQNIRVGNQQDWFSIEHCTSARYLDFMERAPIMDVFSGPNNNGYAPGVSYFGNTEDKMAGLQLGVYKNNAYDSGFPYSVGNAFEYGGRAIWTPYYDEASEGRYMVHTGFAAEYRSFNTDLPGNQNGENVRVRSRGDLRISTSTLTPNYADTGNFFALGQTLIDPEIAVVWGPWTLQAEYVTGWFNGARTQQGGTKLGNVMMSGGYAECLYFLTGENKVYNRQSGIFGQTIPKNNVNFSECHYGAWQVGMRYDWVDLNSGLVNGGRNQDVTLGVNWWINPNIRYQFNVVGTYINNPTNTSAAVGGSTVGSLQGSQFTGEGLIMAIGTRMDISY